MHPDYKAELTAAVHDVEDKIDGLVAMGVEREYVLALEIAVNRLALFKMRYPVMGAVQQAPSPSPAAK